MELGGVDVGDEAIKKFGGVVEEIDVVAADGGMPLTRVASVARGLKSVPSVSQSTSWCRQSAIARSSLVRVRISRRRARRVPMPVSPTSP